jgi:putative DNA primase/helicase
MVPASDYAAHGLALVPIPTGQKGPSSKGWNERENVITDPQKASSLKGNIGLAHVYSEPRTMALDIDDLPKARVWLGERGVDLDALLEADDGVQISSGRKGRAKLLYRLPPEAAPIRIKQITDPKTGDMWLEFRCASANGRTMQDVLPPSIHPETGKPYEWAGKGNWRSIPEIPDQLLQVWQSQLKPTTKPSSRADMAADDSSVITLPPETIRDLRSALLSMRADDHGLWVKAGMALKPLGDIGRGLWLEWSLTSEKSQHD